jgi:hypothetical protein
MKRTFTCWFFLVLFPLNHIRWSQTLGFHPLTISDVQQMVVEHARESKWKYDKFDDRGLAYETSVSGSDRNVIFTVPTATWDDHSVTFTLEARLPERDSRSPLSNMAVSDLQFIYQGRWKLTKRYLALMWVIDEPAMTYEAQGWYLENVGQHWSVAVPNKFGYTVRFPERATESSDMITIPNMGSFPVTSYVLKHGTLRGSVLYRFDIIDFGSRFTDEQLNKELLVIPPGVDAHREVTAISPFPGVAYHLSGTFDNHKGIMITYIYLAHPRWIANAAAKGYILVLIAGVDYSLTKEDYLFLGSLFTANSSLLSMLRGL